MVADCTVAGFFDALAGFSRAHPGVMVTLAEGDPAALTARAWTP